MQAWARARVATLGRSKDLAGNEAGLSDPKGVLLALAMGVLYPVNPDTQRCSSADYREDRSPRFDRRVEAAVADSGAAEGLVTVFSRLVPPAPTPFVQGGGMAGVRQSDRQVVAI